MRGQDREVVVALLVAQRFLHGTFQHRILYLNSFNRRLRQDDLTNKPVDRLTLPHLQTVFRARCASFNSNSLVAFYLVC